MYIVNKTFCFMGKPCCNLAEMFDSDIIFP
jgi:hypothetical protein